MPRLQDGVLSSRSVSESLQISEGEAESGDSGSKLDFSGDSPSRPNSDIADVSLSSPRALLLRVCCPGLLCITALCPPEPFPWENLLVSETGREYMLGVYPGLDYPGINPCNQTEKDGCSILLKTHLPIRASLKGIFQLQHCDSERESEILLLPNQLQLLLQQRLLVCSLISVCSCALPCCLSLN